MRQLLSSGSAQRTKNSMVRTLKISKLSFDETANEFRKIKFSRLSCFEEVIVFAKLAEKGNIFTRQCSIFAIFVIFLALILKQANPTLGKYVCRKVEK